MCVMYLYISMNIYRFCVTLARMITARYQYDVYERSSENRAFIKSTMTIVHNSLIVGINLSFDIDLYAILNGS